MSILPRLASSLGRRDEEPNIQLAQTIAGKKNKKAIAELVENLNNKSSGIRNDCIKVLYESGALEPSLIAPHLKVFLTLLDHKDNRLQWGAMTAIAAIVKKDPKSVFASLSKITAAADRGSVITRDQAVNILISLIGIPAYEKKAFGLLIDQLKQCPMNQLPMYAENSMHVITEKNKELFAETLMSRLGKIEKETKRRRVEKVIRKMKEL
jgi:HEAT repeat protein